MDRAADRYLADTIARQLGEADIVILNKADLVPAGRMDEAARWLSDRWPAARLVPSVRAKVDPQVVLGVGAAPRATGILRLPGHVTAGYVSVAITLDGRVDGEALARALSGEVEGLVRAKGVVTGAAGGPVSLQVVGRRYDVLDARPQAMGDSPFGRIVAIGLSGVMSKREVESVVARHTC
jgi:G3E family GTPase